MILPTNNYHMSRREYENIKILKGYFVSINLINP